MRGASCRLRVVAEHAGLGQLEVPVAVIVPDEAVQSLSHRCEVEAFERDTHHTHGGSGPRCDPAILDRRFRVADFGAGGSVERQEDEATRVPEFGDETPPYLVELIEESFIS